MLLHTTYPIIKRTKCGAWIDYWGSKKFVNLEARKRFACLTAEEALKSFQARKRRQISILKHRLAEAEAALTLKEDGQTTYFGVEDLIPY